MPFYPVMLDVSQKPCLVVGGGQVARRKVKTLVSCGARVTVVSPNPCAEILELRKNNIIRLHLREYSESDMCGNFLVIGATDNQEINQKVASDARKHGVLCNIADVPRLCDFILPSIIRRGDLVIAVSTSGKSPAFAKRMRKDLEKEFGWEYGVFLWLMGEIRKRLLSKAHAPEAHKEIFEKLIQADLLGMVCEKRLGDIQILLDDICGQVYDWRPVVADLETRMKEAAS